ncbi:MAG: phosphoglucosamine mutase [Clostridiales bacterium]|nr:phosphoglucosamine mutase [Clostridiales bacterium]
MGKYFGTDGVRGVANTELTPELAFSLGRYGSMVLASHVRHKPRILIGADTRISCAMLESALVAGICSAGADAVVCGVIPTPGVAYLTKLGAFDAGAVISASHNSFEFNGIKFFDRNGYKLPDSVEDEIESYITGTRPDDKPRLSGHEIGQRLNYPNAADCYREHLLKSSDVDLRGLKIAIDCANGASSGIAPDLFRASGGTVVTIGTEPDGLNINDGCGSTHMEKLCRFVTDEKCDLGIAFDGDADRMLAVDSSGNCVDGDVIMAIIGSYMQSRGCLSNNTIVVTVMSNMGLDIFARENGLRLEKTAVGDRYVLENMQQNHYNLGGEQSGHIILLDHATTGDGMLSALWLLKALREMNLTLAEAARIMKVLPQVVKSARVLNGNKEKAMNDEEIKRLCRQKEEALNGKGRVLVRASGTEPVIRVMLEGEDKDAITGMADTLVDLIVKKYC